MPTENEIRDRLSKTLGVLEAGLTLLEVNHKLPNAVGAKGFIDILARDRLGNFVIIELKRSDQSSREALFEILKYILWDRTRWPLTSTPPDRVLNGKPFRSFR